MEKTVLRLFLSQQYSEESHKDQALKVISISNGCITNYWSQFLLSSTVTTKHCTVRKPSSSDMWATTQRSAFGCENKCLTLAEEHRKGAAGGLSCTLNSHSPVQNCCHTIYKCWPISTSSSLVKKWGLVHRRKPLREKSGVPYTKGQNWSLFKTTDFQTSFTLLKCYKASPHSTLAIYSQLVRTGGRDQPSKTGFSWNPNRVFCCPLLMIHNHVGLE